MLGFLRFAMVLALCAGGVVSAADGPPITRLDVVQESGGECRYRWILEPGETRLVYCDLSTLPLPRFSVVMESGSYAVPGHVSDTFDSPASGAIVVLHNATGARQRGTSRVRPIPILAPDSV